MTTKQAADQADPVKVARPLVLHPWEVRGLLSGSITQLRRPVKFSPAETGMPRSTEFDPSRAWADRGFPDSDGPHKGGYRYGYLHVPVAIPGDGWAADPKDDAIWRVRCEDEPGDLLWGRETWCLGTGDGKKFGLDVQCRTEPWCIEVPVVHRAVARTLADKIGFGKWRSSTTMPQWASRLTLEVISVRAERLRSITESDAVACHAYRFIDSLDGRSYDKFERDWIRWTKILDPVATRASARGTFIAAWERDYGKVHPARLDPWVWVRTVRVIPREATP